MKKRLLFFTLLLALLFSLSLFPAGAAGTTYCIDDGAIVIGEAADEVNFYVEQNGVKTNFPPSTVITVVGRSVTTNTILIKNNVTVDLILHNVNIQSATFLKAPLCIDNGETVRINLIGTNSLIGSDFMAGLQTSARSTLSINGSGTLTATGGADAAGIGGGWRTGTPGSDAGVITIGGGVTVIATGGENAAGIGGGLEGSAKEITLKGSAKITATGGKGGAGIGGGNGGTVHRINVETSGELLATGGTGAAGIGGGNGGKVTNLTLNASAPIRAYGGEGGAAIGSGKNGTLHTLHLAGSSAIRAKGGTGAAAVGLGEGATGTQITLTDKISLFAMGSPAVGCGKNASLDTLTLDQNCTVNAFGTGGSAAIGMGAGAKLKALTVSGNATVFAMGGMEGAGVGGGKSGTPDQITLTGRANVTAVGGLGGAGVGSGFGAAYANISITSSAKVYAQGGNYGAGIGSGGRDTAEAAQSTFKILITDQTNVNAYGGKSAAGIGGGALGAGAILEISQNAKVFATNENEITLIPPATPLTGSTAAQTSLTSVNAQIATKVDLTPYTFDSSDPTKYSLIYFSPVAAQIASAGKTIAVGSIPSQPAGNGAGCSVAGSTHISGGASLNGLFGDVTLTLSLGEGATDMVITLAKNASYNLPEAVSKAGYTFRGWYRDMDLTKPVSGKITVKEDTVIYAGWNAVQVELEEGEIDRAFRDSFYTYRFVTAAGTDSTTFSVIAGTLPQGLELSADGTLSGTPIVAGRFNFTLQYLNANGTSGTKEVTLAVYDNLKYVFRITTGDTNGSASKAEVMMSFSFTDRFTGEKKSTQTVNLTSLLLNYYDDPLQRGAIVELPLVFESNVGIPEEFTFTCEDEDGWHCQSVQVRFEGDDMTEAFEKSFVLNRWFGEQDDNNFWGVFLTVVIVVASVIIVLGVTFLLLIRNKKVRTFLKRKGFLQGKKKAPKA